MSRKDDNDEKRAVQADATIKEANRAGFKVGEEEPAPTSFVKITVNQKIELRTTTYVPSRKYRVSVETADELGGAVATREETIL